MLNTIFRSAFSLFCLLVLVSCTSPDVSTVSTHDFLQSTSTSDKRLATKLVAGDSIEVSVEVDGSMEVSRHRVDLSHLGFVTLPLVGDVRVGDLTLEGARTIISKTYSAYYVNPPVIMVSMTNGQGEGEWGYVTVMGRVARPGRIPLPDADGINLTEAIQAAGGFAMSAKQSDIRISRVNEKGKKIQVSLDFEDIGLGGSAESDINLAAGDIVYVPERLF
ncbi:MAG: polysaccharide biosynthesis/export family protein [Pontiella sp.]